MEDIIKLIDLSLEDGRLSQDDYRIILKKAESMGISEEEFNLILSKRVKQFEPRADFDTQKSGSKLPYIFAAFAVAFTFVDWIGFYSRSSVMGTSATGYIIQWVVGRLWCYRCHDLCGWLLL